MKNLYKSGLVVAVAAVSAVALAQGVTPAKSAAEAGTAIEARKALFKDIKDTYEPLTAMLKRQRELDTAVIAKNAARLSELAGRIPGAYTVDTRQFKDVKTDALDGIWASQADFRAKSEAFGKAAANAATVAGSGDKAGSLKAVAEIGKTCGGCHDSYKTKS